jgi:hypothetical protein
VGFWFGTPRDHAKEVPMPPHDAPAARRCVPATRRSPLSRRRLWQGCAAILVLAGPRLGRGDVVAQNGEGCDGETVRHVRALTVYFGTVAVAGGGPRQDHLQLTDLITTNLANAIRANFADQRVTASLDPWIDDSVSDMEWVLAPSEHLDAEGALRAAFAAFAQAHGGKLSFAAPIDHGTEEYLIALWATSEPDPACPGGLRQIDHEGYAWVTYIELNATVEKDKDRRDRRRRKPQRKRRQRRERRRKRSHRGGGGGGKGCASAAGGGGNTACVG